MYNGVINIYKEKGFTSHDVVAKMRGILKQKKIGHTGTLDPDAVGVLPVCLGSATKLCDMLTDRDKEYIALLRLGIETDTQDTTGKVLKECQVAVCEEEVREVIASFTGRYEQVPPMYSALKVDGKKLYELARQGKEVERKARPVTIYEIEVLECSLPDITIRVACSKGTYIRTLCHDIGRKLGCGGAMAALQRTKAGMFKLDSSITLSELEKIRDEGKLESVVIPVDEMFGELAAVQVTDEAVKLVQNGNPFYTNQILQRRRYGDGEEVLVYDGTGRFYGIYYCHGKENKFKPRKMFLS